MKIDCGNFRFRPGELHAPNADEHLNAEWEKSGTEPSCTCSACGRGGGGGDGGLPLLRATA